MNESVPSHPSDIKTADWHDPKVWNEAPIYGMRSAPAMLARMDRESEPRAKRLPFEPDHKPWILDTATGAHWEPVALPDHLEEWAFGEVTIPSDNAEKYLWNTYHRRDEALALLPEIFVLNNLVMAERARDLIEAYIPGKCYFSRVHFFGKETKNSAENPYYNVTVRHFIDYTGPRLFKLFRERFGV